MKLPTGYKAKILIDSGSNKNFISPHLIPESRKVSCKTIKISNNSGHHKSSQKFVTQIFGVKKDVPFYLFKFHSFFDGILGYETLSQLQAVLDIGNNTLKFPHKTVKLEIRKMGSPDVTINANSAKLIKIPVVEQKGDVFLSKKLKLSEVSIPPGVYTAKDGFITSLAMNYGENIAFNWVEPIKVNKVDKLQEINFNHGNIQGKSGLKYEELDNLIRTNHLNYEEKSKLLDVLRKNLNIIQKPGENLHAPRQLNIEFELWTIYRFIQKLIVTRIFINPR